MELSAGGSRMAGDQRALLLVGNGEVADKIAALMAEIDWSTQAVADAEQAVNLLEETDFDALIVDIEKPRLHGLGLLAFCRRRAPSTTLFAVCRGGNSPAMRMARTIGAAGFFYLTPGEEDIDLRYGVAAHLLHSQITLTADDVVGWT